ncbi:MAG: DNA polymerase III subunit gamma/tau [Treponema sp.]|nr:DNA polymerase III subunit gamma/tau [Treponema sp.]
MAYEVTATRRRPQQFEDLAGQEFVAETLKNSIKTKQFAHAYLFAGPRGCGKTSTARILAKALNCQNSSEPTCTPCGECESCKAITNSSSLDVIEIDGASNTSVNDVRQIKDEVMFPPTSCRYKIYIIDEVHMLSTSAFNALLKTIEEPPAHVIFIFATTELQKVPATIKSRCQQYNFRLVSTDRLKGLLEDACREMNIQAEDEALYWIAKESGGSVRDCYTLFDQIAAFSDGHITYEKIRDKLGLLGVDRLNSLFDSCTAGNSEDVLNQLDSFLQSGISIDQLISNSTEYLRSLLLIKNGIKKESLLGQSAERYSMNVLNSWNTIQTERALSIFLQLYRDIRYSLSPRYELELAFSRLCWLKQYVSPSEVKAAIDKAHALLCSAPQQGAAAQSTAQAATAHAQQSDNIYQNAVKDEHMTSAATQNNFENERASNQEADSGASLGNSGTAGTGTGVPNGLHMFSMLQNEQQGTGSGTSGNGGDYQDPTAVTENPNPFYNGGAVPPDNTAAAANYNDNYSYDDLGNPETNDIPDEEWSTTDNSTLEEEIVESYEASVDAQQSSSTQEDVHLSNAPAALSNGSQVNLKDLYEQLISKLTPENPMASSALMQTSPWILSGNTIQTTIESEFQLRSIESSIPQINGILSKICGTQILFEISKKEQPQIKESNIPVPPQVQLICSVFKGTIVGGKK